MYNNFKSVVFAGLGAIALSACQSDNACDFSSSPSQLEGANEMAMCLDTLSPTPISELPAGGSAVYNGYAAGVLGSINSPTDSLLGDARMTATFGGGTSVTGTLNNFRSANEGSLGGSLSVLGGTISASGTGAAVVTGLTISGSLTGYGTESVSFSGASGIGTFAGSNAAGLTTATQGTATFSGATPSDTFTMTTIGFK